MKREQLRQRMRDAITYINSRSMFGYPQLKWSESSRTSVKYPSNAYSKGEYDYCYPILKQLWASRDPIECTRLKAKLAQRRDWHREMI